MGRLHARSWALLKEGFEAQGDGLRGYHYRLLAAIEEWGPMSQADLSRGTGIDRSDVTAALNELEARGLVERAVDPDHRRRNVVSITAAGCAELVRLDAVVDEVQRKLLAPLTKAQRRQLMELGSLLLGEPR